MVNTDHAKGGPTLPEQLARIRTLPPSVLAQPTPFSYAFGTGRTGAANGSTAAPVFQPSIIFTDPADSLTPESNAFNFHYNPSSFTSAVQWTTSITDTGTTTPNNDANATPLVTKGLVGQFETFGFQILLNRMVEASLYYANPFNNTLAQLFQTYGTLCDLSLLYRTVNGIQENEIDAMVTDGLSYTVPATDRGFLTGAHVVVSLGAGAVTFAGWVTNLQVQHAKFINSMTPVLTTVDVTFQRGLFPGLANTPPSSSKKPTDPTTGKVAKKWWQN